MLAGPQCDHKHPAEVTLTAQCSKPPWTNEWGWRPHLGMPQAELRLTEFSVPSGLILTPITTQPEPQGEENLPQHKGPK